MDIRGLAKQFCQQYGIKPTLGTLKAFEEGYNQGRKSLKPKKIERQIPPVENKKTQEFLIPGLKQGGDL